MQQQEILIKVLNRKKQVNFLKNHLFYINLLTGNMEKYFSYFNIKRIIEAKVIELENILFDIIMPCGDVW